MPRLRDTGAANTFVFSSTRPFPNNTIIQMPGTTLRRALLAVLTFLALTPITMHAQEVGRMRDHELREEAEERGLGFFRVPVPHAAPRFIGLLADLVDQAVERSSGDGSLAAAGVPLFQCRCKPTLGTMCTNGGA